MNYNIVPKNNINLFPNKGIGINIPFNGNTGLNITFDTKTSIRTNLLNYLLTNRRERLLNNNFISNIRNILFEQNIDIDNIKDSIIDDIIQNFQQIKIDNIDIINEENKIHIYIKYSIKQSNIQDEIQINF